MTKEEVQKLLFQVADSFEKMGEVPVGKLISFIAALNKLDLIEKFILKHNDEIISISKTAAGKYGEESDSLESFTKLKLNPFDLVNSIEKELINNPDIPSDVKSLTISTICQSEQVPIQIRRNLMKAAKEKGWIK